MSSSEYEIAETLILNLGVLGEITEGRKINTKEKYLSLYDTTFWQGAVRWYYGDSRTSVADKIKTITISSFDIINKALKDIEKCNNFVVEKYLNMNPMIFLKTMKKKLIKSNKGLKHLKDTYIADILFQKQIQIHINALDRQIHSINSVTGIDEEVSDSEEKIVIDKEENDSEESFKFSPKFHNSPKFKNKNNKF
jgi:hypothetical protein